MVPRSCLVSTPCRLATAMYIASRMAAGALMVMRGGDLVQRDFLEEHLHVLQRGDGHAHLAHLALAIGSSAS